MQLNERCWHEKLINVKFRSFLDIIFLRVLLDAFLALLSLYEHWNHRLRLGFGEELLKQTSLFLLRDLELLRKGLAHDLAGNLGLNVPRVATRRSALRGATVIATIWVGAASSGAETQHVEVLIQAWKVNVIFFVSFARVFRRVYLWVEEHREIPLDVVSKLLFLRGHRVLSRDLPPLHALNLLQSPWQIPVEVGPQSNITQRSGNIWNISFSFKRSLKVCCSYCILLIVGLICSSLWHNLFLVVFHYIPSLSSIAAPFLCLFFLHVSAYFCMSSSFWWIEGSQLLYLRRQNLDNLWVKDFFCTLDLYL